MARAFDFSFRSLHDALAGGAEVADVVLEAARAARSDEGAAWIHVLDDREIERWLPPQDAGPSETLPLYGLPFAINDDIDLAGTPTTAACPAFAYTPERSAPVVERLVAAGAVPIGKTNLDQLGVGLAGTRSPFGAVRNACQPERVAGGASAGSAVAVATGQVAFALGTDAVGSGRVPAAFNHVFGHKPTRGWLSTRGVVPGCRSLDCVSVLTRTPAEAASVLAVAGAFDARDPYARPLPEAPAPPAPGRPFRFGVPPDDQLVFDEAGCSGLFARAREALAGMGGTPWLIDASPFLEAGELLQRGPWLAERLVTTGALLRREPGALHPVTRAILESASHRRAVDVFAAQQRLAALGRACHEALAQVELLLLPTTPGVPRREEIDADPVGANERLGTWTSFVNGLDLAASAVPVGRLSDGAPWGVTLVAPAGHDARLIARAAALQRACVVDAGRGLPLTGERLPGLLGEEDPTRGARESTRFAGWRGDADPVAKAARRR